jgi:tetratricopeptide (TPR) repeat protein
VYCKRHAGFAILAAFLAGGCSRRPPKPPVERLAVLRFENLSGDTSADWIGRALSEVVAGTLSAAPGIVVIPSGRMHALNPTLGIRSVSAPGISSERTMALAAGANRIGYGEYSFVSGRLEARLTVEDPETNKMVQVAAATSAGRDPIDAATALARQLSDRVVSYGTRSVPALKAWVAAMESADPAVVQGALNQCLAADPDFGPPYLALAQWKAQRQDRPGAIDLLGQALAHADRMPLRDRIRIEFELANLRGDAAGQQRALTDLLKLDPRDPSGWRALAQMALNRRDLAQAIQSWQKAIEIEDDPSSENQLAYAAANAGDLNTAVRALHRYQALRPADANAIDSLGDVHLITGHLREAENFYREAIAKDPNFLNHADYFKAAMAHLMTGDVPGADTLANQYADARSAARDPLAGLHRAEWLWISGRRKDGYEQLAKFAREAEAGAQREPASRAYAELAIWSLLQGDHAAAAEMARKSAPLAGPSSIGLTILARFLAQPPASPDEWSNRAARLFPATAPSGFRDLALAYALLLDRHFQPASVILKRIHDTTSPNADEGVSILLAWSLLETGRVQDAAPLLKLNPVPQATGVGPMTAFYFPRLYELRALAAEKLGNPAAARENRKLYRRLSGQ